MKYIRVILTERRGLQFLGYVGVLTEIFQVEIHQACIIVFVFICKESELVVLIETSCSGKGINCYKSASCPIPMSEQIFYTVQDKTANALSFISLTNSQTPNFNSGIVVTLLAELYSFQFHSNGRHHLVNYNRQQCRHW